MGARGLVLIAACALLGCRGSGPVEPVADVYVPAPTEGGVDAGDESTGTDASAIGPGQVDRAGHPLASVLLVPGVLQDPFNAEPSFEMNLPRVLQDALEARLELLDRLAVGDGGPDPVDFPVDAGPHALLPVFATDVLLVDTALPCTQDGGGFVPTYLDLEQEIYLSYPQHATCGGRTPAENVVDKTLNLLVTGDRDGGPVVTQGAFGPTKPPTTTFPYLAAPN